MNDGESDGGSTERRPFRPRDYEPNWLEKSDNFESRSPHSSTRAFALKVTDLLWHRPTAFFRSKCLYTFVVFHICLAVDLICPK